MAALVESVNEANCPKVQVKTKVELKILRKAVKPYEELERCDRELCIETDACSDMQSEPQRGTYEL